MEVDDKYFDGVWHDLSTGDFCRFVRTEQGVGLTEPHRPDSDPYYHFSEDYDYKEDIVATIEGDFRRVPDEAVENPAEILDRALRIISRNDIEELSRISFNFAISVRYARTQVKVGE